MKENNKPFLWIDLVKSTPDCEELGFGVYVLGPTNYDPASSKEEDALRFLCWGQSRRPVMVRTPSVIDPFGPVFTPDLMARVWQAPRQDVLAVNIEPSLVYELSSTQVRYLAAEQLRVVTFVASLEWNEDAFISKHETMRCSYHDDPRYRATAERLRREGIHEMTIKPDLRRDAIGIPISICLRNTETLADGIMMLESEQPPVTSVRLLIPRGNNGVVIEPGSLIEYRGKTVASILRLEGSVAVLEGE
jgi:hypothetical protein